jgi:hypothetical protein
VTVIAGTVRLPATCTTLQAGETSFFLEGSGSGISGVQMRTFYYSRRNDSVCRVEWRANKTCVFFCTIYRLNIVESTLAVTPPEASSPPTPGSNVAGCATLREGFHFLRAAVHYHVTEAGTLQRPSVHHSGTFSGSDDQDQGPEQQPQQTQQFQQQMDELRVESHASFARIQQQTARSFSP